MKQMHYKYLLTATLSVFLFFNASYGSHLENLEAPIEDVTELVLISHSFKAGRKSFFRVGDKSERLRRGLTLVHFNSPKSYEFRTFDTYGDKEDLKKITSILERMLTENAKFALLVHDSAVEDTFENHKMFVKLGLKELSTLKNRQAYAMHNLEGSIKEFIDDAAITITVTMPSEVKSDIVYFPRERYQFVPNVNRFIAHAGGAIDGHAYTIRCRPSTRTMKKDFVFLNWTSLKPLMTALLRPMTGTCGQDLQNIRVSCPLPLKNLKNIPYMVTM